MPEKGVGQTIGTCGLCGGRVVFPFIDGIIPYCLECGAVKLNPHIPVIPMKKVEDQKEKHDAEEN